ncbi:MAG: hypothetical protein WBG65_03040 [Sulfurimonadaceae bacterium]
MKKIMLSIVSIAIMINFTGCSRTAMPNLVAGKYYMAGDDNCRKYRVLSSTRIMCQDANGKDMGYRDAMTNQQISMYQHNRQIAQQEAAQTQQALNNLNQQLQRQNEQMNYNNQQMMNRNNVYKVRTVGPYGY